MTASLRLFALNERVRTLAMKHDTIRTANRLSPCPEGVRREAAALAAVVDAQAVYRGAALARTAVAS